MHCLVLVAFLALGAYCLLPAGRTLAQSLPYVVFVSNFAITYSAAAAIEALYAGRKADPDDPA